MTATTEPRQGAAFGGAADQWNIQLEILDSSISARARRNNVRVYRVVGEEALGTTFRYEVDFAVSVSSASEAKELVGKVAGLRLKVQSGPHIASRWIWGYVARAQKLNLSPDGKWRYYRVRISPTLAKLAANHQSRVHATTARQSIQELIKNKILGRGPDFGTNKEGSIGLSSEYVDFTGMADATAQQLIPGADLLHVAQYEESDLDFINRHCEQYGVLYHFRTDIGSTGGDFRPNTERVAFICNHQPLINTRSSDRIDLVETGVSSANQIESCGHIVTENRKTRTGMHSFEQVAEPYPTKVVVVDHDPSLASAALKAEYTIPGGTQGVHVDSESRFSSVEEGQKFARVRAEQIYFQHNYCKGATISPAVAPGKVVGVWAEVADNWKTGKPTVGLFLVTHSRTEFTRPFGDGFAAFDGSPLEARSENRFRCVLADGAVDGISVYRLPRRTPRPRLPGIYAASTAPGSTDDENARGKVGAQADYRIVHHYDQRGSVAGNPSAPVCKVEPYMGAAEGMHFPLRPNTEVLVAYRNGDPDRPFILGSAPPHADYSGPVTDVNTTHHVIQTPRNQVELRDGAKTATTAGSVHLATKGGAPQTTDTTRRKGAYLRLGRKADGTEETQPLNAHYTAQDYGTEDTKPTAADDGIFLHTQHALNETVESHRNSWAEALQSRAKDLHFSSGGRMVIHAGGKDSEPGDEDAQSGQLLLKSAGDLIIQVGGSVRTNSSLDTSEIANRLSALETQVGERPETSEPETSENEELDPNDPSAMESMESRVGENTGDIDELKKGQGVNTAGIADLDAGLANLTQVVAGNYIEMIEGDKKEKTSKNKESYVQGYDTKMVLGLSNSMLLGLKTTAHFGAKVSINIAGSMTLAAAMTAKYLLAGEFKVLLGGSLSIAGPMKISVGSGTGLSVKAPVHLNQYQGIKLETIAVAEFKKIGAQVKISEGSLSALNATAEAYATMVRTVGTSAVTGGMHTIL